MLGNPSWGWGLSLIVLTMMIHAAAILTMAFVGAKIRIQLETRRLHRWNLIAIQIFAASDWIAIGHAARNRVRGLGSSVFVARRCRLAHRHLALFRRLDGHARRITANAATTLAADGRSRGSQWDDTVRR